MEKGCCHDSDGDDDPLRCALIAMVMLRSKMADLLHHQPPQLLAQSTV